MLKSFFYEQKDICILCNYIVDCLPSELRCMNGKCVHKSAFCDDINDCGDWSDEPDVCDCGNYLKLSDKNKICDGEINCFDKSDENPLLCPCTNDSYVCEKFVIQYKTNRKLFLTT